MSDPGDLEARLDRLYASPLGEFIALRNDLASDLKGGGYPERAVAVRRRAKPSLAAWTVNRLFHDESAAFDDLIEAGERQRRAQQAGDVAELNEAGEQRRAAIAAMMELSARQLEQDGHALGASTLAKVERTLETITVYGRSGLLESRPGRLERELEPPGFEVLATLQSLPARPRKTSPEKVADVPAKPAPGPRPVESPRPTEPPRAELAERRRGVKRGEAALEKARQRSATLRDGWRTQRAEASQLEDAAQAALRHAEQARSAADRAKVRVRRSEAALERSESREQEALDRLERARADLEELTSGC